MIEPDLPATEAMTQVLGALASPDPSVRLQAALAAGTRVDPATIEPLIARCGVEPDFYVRDMLTWALTRHRADVTVPLLLNEIRTGGTQARSQALHTLSKIGDPRGWAAITPEVLQDSADDVARSAWRAAVILVPTAESATLASILATQLGRGDRAVQLSLSRALVELGPAAFSVLAEAATSGRDEVRIHAAATQRLAENVDEGFDTAVFEAKRQVALGGDAC